MDNPSSCGGGHIIQDSDGTLKATFSKNFDAGTTNGAELQELISGIRLCKDMGY